MLGRRRRLAVPFVVAGLVALGAAVPSLSAGATPNLPALTPAQLVARALATRVDAFSGTLQWTADLGLPSLGGLTTGGQGEPTASSFDPSELTSGTHSFEIWVDGASRQRIAAESDLSETDLVRDGSQAWVWTSATQKVTHYVLVPPAGRAAAPPGLSIDPQAVATRLIRLLQHAGTSVRVDAPVRVAGVAAYELQLSPDAAAARASTVASVDVAVDAANGFPLRVAVHAAGQSAPALEVGFTSVRFAAPASTVFAPPAGRTTVTRVVDAGRGGLEALAGLGGLRTVGAGWTTVGVIPGNLAAGAELELEAVATPVSGAWGSGQLLRSSLLDALFLPDGQVLAGFVTPATLEADAGALAP